MNGKTRVTYCMYLVGEKSQDVNPTTHGCEGFPESNQMEVRVL